MKIVSRILRRAARLPFAPEYLCVDRQDFAPQLRVCMKQGEAWNDITHQHLFVGYKPLLFALPEDAGEDIGLAFFSSSQHDPVARLNMQRVGVFEHYALYRGVHGEHQFLPRWKQWCLSAYNSSRRGEPGNVHLEENLLRQVQIAYALPRPVSLISVGGAAAANLFPTDLHGPLADDRYLVSLRKGGSALEQVLAGRQLLLATMPATSAGAVYRLGKNHMRPMCSPAGLPVHDLFGGIPVPDNALGIRYLELEKEQAAGIHSLLQFRIAKSYGATGAAGLGHVHAVYASWRQKMRLPGNYFGR